MTFGLFVFIAVYRQKRIAQHKHVLAKACDATRDAFIDLLVSCGFNVNVDVRRTLHRRIIVFVGDASFASRGWCRGHRAIPVKQVYFCFFMCVCKIFAKYIDNRSVSFFFFF